MIFNKDIIFIHIGKTGGMSCARYLLENLKSRPVYNCHEYAEEEGAATPVEGVVALSDTQRHWTLQQSLEYINKFDGRTLSDFKKVIAVVRNPVTLEYSFYQHMRKSHIRKQRGDRCQPLYNLADGDFQTFVKHAGYHSPGKTQDEFVRLNGAIPDSVELVKFESINPDFVNAVSAFTTGRTASELETRNKTTYSQGLEDVLTEELENIIYKKHQYIYDSGMYVYDNPYPDSPDQILKRSLERENATPALYSAYANLAEIEQNWTVANERWDSAVERFPDDIGLLFNAGLCRARIGAPKYAIHYFNRVLGIEPRHRAALYHKWLGLLTLKHNDLADRVWLQIQSLERVSTSLESGAATIVEKEAQLAR